MADKGRDLKVSILSDVAQFDATKPADDLDQLADAAGMTRDELADLESELFDVDDDLTRLGSSSGSVRSELDRLGADAKDSARDVEQLGTDAKATAGRVDDAFDKIAAASKRGASQVDSSTERGKESLRDMGEEGQGTARELAASFDGSADSIKDGMQEAATNVLAALGPVGAAIGVAGGLAIGWIRGQAEAAKEEISGLVGVLLDAGGRLDNASVIAKIREFAEDGSITALAAEARAGKVPVSDYLRALAGDPEALERTRAAMARSRDEQKRTTDELRAAGLVTEDTAQASLDNAIALSNMSDNLDDSAEKYGLAAEAAQTFAEVVDPGAEAVDAMSEALAGFVEPIGAYQEALTTKEEAERKTAEKTAAATKDQSDSWEDYVDDVDVSVNDYLTTLEKQVTAQEEWATNLSKLAKRGVDEGVLAELARMGPEGAPLIAKLTTASDAELGKLVALYKRKGTDSSEGLADAIDAGKPKVATATQDIRDDMKRRLSPKINVPVGVTGPDAGDLATIRSQIKGALNGIVVSVDAIAQAALGRPVP